ncbi:sigma-70 family RNA polymerase sigma factor [Asticcacaulis solisilvae]|uniref:sigma-70 family RNA polymerase sigma factor n=1 Tax=Asticcacaulis solisilvae TaxID=1217274 RepID=UPI003FD832DE
MTDDDFERLLAGMRPKLHRYCARMTGSAVDGEDVVQDTLIKAMKARTAGAEVDNPEGWLYRIAHNASLDFLRARTRSPTEPLMDDIPMASKPDPEITRLGFRTFLELPVLQRCAVVLKDVLGHSVEEIAEVADCSGPAAKSALQRGRERLRTLVAEGDAAPLPRLSEDERQRLHLFSSAFTSGDFDTVRRLLAEDVRVDLVQRRVLNGREESSPYFTRYGEIDHWRFAEGTVDGRAVMLVYDARGAMERPAHFVVPVWEEGRITAIKDFLYAPYAMEGCEWVRFDQGQIGSKTQ